MDPLFTVTKTAKSNCVTFTIPFATGEVSIISSLCVVAAFGGEVGCLCAVEDGGAETVEALF